MDEVATFVVVAFDPRHRAVGERIFLETVLGAGGLPVTQRPSRSTQGAAGSLDAHAARFDLLGDATEAVVALVRSGVVGAPSLRVALRRGGVSRPADQTPAVDLGRAYHLLDAADAGQVLLDAATAVAVEPALPSDVELFYVATNESGPAGVRLYELRAGGGTAPHQRVLSNLAWARRAAGGPVLDRTEALATLAGAWDSTLHGRSRGTVLVGEAGIGKTAVAAEFALRIHATGARVLYGRWDRDQISPYQGIREALAPSLATPLFTPGAVAEPAEHRQLRQLFPELGPRWAGRHPPLGGDSSGERIALYDAVTAWLDRLAADRAVLVVLDDIHWSERSSRLLVEHVASATGTAPWMLLLTARASGSDIASPGLAVGALRTDVDLVELSGLSAPAVAELVEHTLGCQVGPDDEVVTWLTSVTAGNPLFVQQVLRTVCGTATDALIELHTVRHRLPAPLADVVRWRVRHLPATTRRLLADAAVVASSTPLGVLAEAVSSPPVIVRSTLEPAIHEELIRVDPDTDRCSFTHELVRLALGTDVDAERARRLHRRAAIALEARASDSSVEPDEVAHHYLRGAGPTTVVAAVAWARRGAEAAREATGFDEAAHLLAEAVDVHDRFGVRPGAGPDPVACELRLELAEAHDRASQFSERDQRHLEAAIAARELGRDDLFARAALGYGGRLPAAPLPDPTARELLEELLGTLPAADTAPRALAMARLAHRRHLDGPYELRRAMADEAVAMVRQLGQPEFVATALVSWCFALEGPDDVEEQLSAGSEIAGIGRQLRDIDLELQGSRIQVTALFGVGEYQAARELARSYAAQARESRHQDHIRLATMAEIVWAGLAGHYADVEDMTSQLTSQMNRSGHDQGAFLQATHTFIPRWLHGQLERTRPIVEELAAREPGLAAWWAVLAWVDAATGHQDRALARLDEHEPATAIASVERNYLWWPTMVACAVAASSCGHRRWAEAVSSTIAPYSGYSAVSGFVLFFGAVDHHLGTLDLVRDRPEPAVARLRAALEHHRVLDAPAFVALSASWLARALLARGQAGDRDEAAALVAEADVLAERFGLAGLPDIDAGDRSGPVSSRRGRG